MTPTTTPTRMNAWLEHAWMTRYLDRQLVREEVDWFEGYVLDKPDLLAMIEADTQLREALAADAPMRDMEWSGAGGSRQGGAYGDKETPLRGIGGGPGANDARMVEEPQTHRAGTSVNDAQPTAIRSTHTTNAPKRKTALPPWFAMAASLLIGVGVGWTAMRALQPTNQTPEVMASPMRVIYDTMRGEPTPPRVEHADSVSSYALIEVAVPPGAQDITLKINDQPEQKLTPSPDGFVSFLVERGRPSRQDSAVITYSSQASRFATQVAIPK